MKPMYQQTFTVTDAAVDCFGRLKPSMLLFYCQEVAGSHCLLLGTDWETLAEKNMFWAVIRQRVQITRLPRSGETIRVETWPMPTTKVCYPRSTVAYDEQGNEYFRSIGLWVLMDRNTRAMILPGKSGVTVEGTLTGSELAAPASLGLMQLEQLQSRTVAFTDLDRNGHMNNTRCLDWMQDLLPGSFHAVHTPREFTVCYHTEALEGETLQLHWQLRDGTLNLDTQRQSSAKTGRVFSLQVLF